MYELLLQMLLLLPLAPGALADTPTPEAVEAIPEIGFTLPGVVSKVVDVDTVDVEVRLTVRVRFEDFDGVEKGTTLGMQGKQELIKLAEGKPCRVKLKMPKQGNHFGQGIWTYDRWLGKVWLEGENKNLTDWSREHGYEKKK